MDISSIDTSAPRVRQLRDEPQSGRYPTRGYQQHQPSLERGAADQTDLKNEKLGKSGLRKGPHHDEAGEICPVDRRQPYQRPRLNLTPSIARRGSMKTVGRPKVGLKKLSVAYASSAVSLSALSTSNSNSTRATPPNEKVLDRRTSRSVCDDRRCEPRGSIRTRC